MHETLRKHWVWLVLAAVVLVGGGAYFLSLPGPRKPGTSGGAKLPGKPADDALDAARESLAKSTDAKACLGALQQFNAWLTRHSDQKPAGLSEESLNVLQTQFGLDAGERAEVASPTFTPLDAHYLETCFLLADAAHGLDVDDLPALTKAEAAFGWVLRQVRLTAQSRGLYPPQHVLRRAFGTDQERAEVFLALLHQLDIPGCMIALPDKSRGTFRYWLPGVLIDHEIYLFDTRLGIPLPGPDGKGVATLNQVRSSPDPFAPLRVDANHPYDVSVEQARQAEVHLTCPLSGLAPRMDLLEKNLLLDRGVRVAFEFGELQSKFEAAVKGKSIAVQVWKRPGDPNTPTRTLRASLPKTEGGTDTFERTTRFYADLVPGNLVPDVVKKRLPLDVDPGRRLVDLFRSPFIGFALRSKGPRDAVLRGRFDEATHQLVGNRELFQLFLGIQRDRAEFDRRVTEWCAQAVTVYAQLRRAERGEGDLQAAQVNVQRLWSVDENALAEIAVDPTKIKEEHPERTGVAVVTELILSSTAAPLETETTYLLALCKHEQAERAGRNLLRSGPNPASADVTQVRDAWRDAADWWETFIKENPKSPGVPVARRWQARAFEALHQPDRAAALLGDLTGPMTPEEQTGRLYLAKAVKAGLAKP